MADESQLDPVVAAIAQRFDYNEGQPAMAEQDMAAAARELAQVDKTQQGTILLHLVALAARFQRLGGESCATAVAQLAWLAAGLIGDMRTLEKAFAGAGVDASAALKTLGVDEHLMPVPRVSPAAKGSAFSMLIDSKKKP